MNDLIQWILIRNHVLAKFSGFVDWPGSKRRYVMFKSIHKIFYFLSQFISTILIKKKLYIYSIISTFRPPLFWPSTLPPIIIINITVLVITTIVYSWIYYFIFFIFLVINKIIYLVYITFINALNFSFGVRTKYNYHGFFLSLFCSFFWILLHSLFLRQIKIWNMK